MTSREARKLLLERISTDKEFYQSLSREDSGDEETDEEDVDGGGSGEVGYDEIDSSKAVKEEVQDVVESAPANSLADIYKDKEDSPEESDAEDRGSGFNLAIYIKKYFLFKDATKKWMEWDGE